MSNYPPLDPWGTGGQQQQQTGGAGSTGATGGAYPSLSPAAAGAAQQPATGGDSSSAYPSAPPLPGGGAYYTATPSAYPAVPAPSKPVGVGAAATTGFNYPTLPTTAAAAPRPQQPLPTMPVQQGAGYRPAVPPQQQQGGAGAQVVVIDPRFCLQQRTTLILTECVAMGGFGGDHFQITDETGRVYFSQAARTFSARDKRVLLDANGQPCVGMSQKLLAMKPTWLIYRGGSFSSDALVANLKSHFSLTPSVSVYLNDGDDESDFKIRGDYRAKKFTISQKLGGGQEREIAKVARESRFSSGTAFMMSLMTDAHRYFLTIEPGVDAAFCTAVALMVDEIFHDTQK